jgi:hypothetical protein
MRQRRGFQTYVVSSGLSAPSSELGWCSVTSSPDIFERHRAAPGLLGVLAVAARIGAHLRTLVLCFTTKRRRWREKNIFQIALSLHLNLGATSLCRL